MKIEILSGADEDLLDGYRFYEQQATGLGGYFLDSLYSDIDSLLVFAGVHRVVYGLYRCLSKRFPFAVYYSIDSQIIRIHAVLDCRSKPSRIKKRLK
ncbi:MAG: type II toxin-antitoxin system RelE/ParE family toxin [Gammaproteobacteria bacterium]|nr:type II toxin-antitoxin system RelE/ParE family toxin [Gammaproteobacteria bacterium]